MNDDRLLGQARVGIENFLRLFLGGGVLLPGEDLLLEHFGPGAIQIHLLPERLSTISKPWRGS